MCKLEVLDLLCKVCNLELEGYISVLEVLCLQYLIHLVDLDTGAFVQGVYDSQQMYKFDLVVEQYPEWVTPDLHLEVFEGRG